MPKKLRVACLHGYGTNAKFMERQMRSFKRYFDKEIEFVFLEGTYEAPHGFILDEKVLNLIEGETRCWNPFISYKYSEAKYAEQVLQPLENYFKNESFDGLIGFSQGAVVSHFLTKVAQRQKVNWKGLQDLKFVILASGNHWSWTGMGFDSTEPINLPSIHLVSEPDFLYRKSIFTVAQFKDPIVIHHSFGHTFPRLGTDEFGQIRKYINKAVREHKESKEKISESRL